MNGWAILGFMIIRNLASSPNFFAHPVKRPETGVA